MAKRKPTKRPNKRPPATDSTPKKGSPPDSWRAAFLAELAATGNVSHSARVASVNKTTVYSHRDSDPEFAAQWREAIDESNDALEAEARRRAVDGVSEPVVYQGELAGHWIDAEGNVVSEDTEGARFVPLTVKKYSDTLLIFLLNGNRPEKFRQNVKLTGKLDHSHSGEIAHRFAEMSDADLDAEIERLKGV